MKSRRKFNEISTFLELFQQVVQHERQRCNGVVILLLLLSVLELQHYNHSFLADFSLDAQLVFQQ
jgi:hypothetical protein